jgi:hypothetical protein
VENAQEGDWVGVYGQPSGAGLFEPGLEDMPVPISIIPEPIGKPKARASSRLPKADASKHLSNFKLLLFGTLLNPKRQSWSLTTA